MTLSIETIPILTDNYIFLLVDSETKACAVVDPAEAEPVLVYLQEHALNLGAILNTHHHFDHVGGNEKLKSKTGCQIYGYGPDKERIPGLDHEVFHGDTIYIGDSKAQVFFVPGHTSGHILYHFKEDKKCFVGDTLFSMGCGRLFEGTPQQMWQSLQTFFDMPHETEIYCAHEYTLDNIRFAESLVGDDPDLQSYKNQCLKKRAGEMPTLPAILGVEKTLNPFLAVAHKSYREKIGLGSLSPEEAFTELRSRKDYFPNKAPDVVLPTP